MWNSPNQRVRAAANAKKRERERSRRPLHVKRIIAHVAVMSESGSKSDSLEVRMVLNDLSIKGGGFFASQALIPGQLIQLSITDPTKLELKAKIIWCQNFAPGARVLSNQPFSFRMGVEFIIESPQEQQSIQEFFDHICRDFLYTSQVS